jgi:putative phage-type endonuclease
MSGRWIDLEIGSPDWLQLITASKVAAILGVSPHDSPRSLWHRMHGDVPAEPQTATQARGHYLEPAILAWFFDQHPELRRPYGRLDRLGTFVHANGWAAASPDAEAVDGDGTTYPVEAKSAADDSGWGTPGTDEIPTGYMAQCMWTMHVLGGPRIYVPMIGPRLTFAEYVVEYDAGIAASIEAKCLQFLESLTADEPPDIDSHPATYESLRRVHPDIDDETVELTSEDAAAYVTAAAAAKRLEADLNKAKSTVAAVMGRAKKATYGGQTVATRQASSSGIPYVKPARTLPTIDLEESA